MDANETERQLQEVRLQRERLALERELARKRRADAVSGGASMVISRIKKEGGSATRAARQIASRWWRPALVVLLLACTAGGLLEWRQMAADAERAAAEARYKAAAEAFVEKQCGKRCVGDGSIQDHMACRRQDLDRYSCEESARHEFLIQESQATGL